MKVVFSALASGFLNDKAQLAANNLKHAMVTLIILSFLLLLLVKFFFRTSCHKKPLIRSISAACKVNDYSFKVLLQTVLSTQKNTTMKK